MGETLANGPPELKGYLNKYTNVARGWGTRWFTLQDGVLSCKNVLFRSNGHTHHSGIDYRHQEDETVASRGSIAMKAANLRVPTSDNVRFEIHSTPSRGHHTVQKWYMKANHPVEAARWIHALQRAIEYAKNESTYSESDTSGKSPVIAPNIPFSLSSTAISQRKTRGETDSVTSSHLQTDDDDVNGSSTGLLEPRSLRSEKADSIGERGDEESGEWSTDHLDSRAPPYDESFMLSGSSATAQLELTSQLLSTFLKPGHSQARVEELQKTLKESMSTVQSMVAEFVQHAHERDEWWRARLAQERKRQTTWEQSLQSVVKEGEALEQELREQARAHRRSRTDMSEGFDTLGGGTLRGRPSILVQSPPAVPEEATDSPLANAQATPAVPTPTRKNTDSTLSAVASSSSSLIGSPIDGPKRRQLSLSASTLHRPKVPKPADVLTPPLSAVTVGPTVDTPVNDVDTDEEDEFFDAIESNALPNLVVSEALKGHEPEMPKVCSEMEMYAGYKNPRKKLPITSDNRPPTSLWSVLKHSIGKDLTKISFPVFFNEPTSMLQRMVGDIVSFHATIAEYFVGRRHGVLGVSCVLLSARDSRMLTSLQSTPQPEQMTHTCE